MSLSWINSPNRQKVSGAGRDNERSLTFACFAVCQQALSVVEQTELELSTTAHSDQVQQEFVDGVCRWKTTVIIRNRRKHERPGKNEKIKAILRTCWRSVSELSAYF